MRSECKVTFKGHSSVKIKNNQADDDSGALYISDITFIEHSTTSGANGADDGGAFYIRINLNINCKGNSMMKIKLTIMVVLFTSKKTQRLHLKKTLQ